MRVGRRAQVRARSRGESVALCGRPQERLRTRRHLTGRMHFSFRCA